MFNLLKILKTVCKQLLVVYLCYAICRILFLVFNYNYFQEIEIADFIGLMFYGLRFDSFSIAATNALYIILALLPLKFYSTNWYQKLLKFIFIFFNAFFLLFNFIDFAYFPFTQKRTTFDVLNLTIGGQTEITKLIPLFLKDYWYLIIIYGLVIILLLKLYNLLAAKQTLQLIPLNFKNSIITFATFIVSLSLTLIAIRGGLQRIPIVLLDAALYTKPQFIPALINTPFTILKTSDIEEIPLLNLIDDNQLVKYKSATHPADTGKFKNTNVCVIILESFSKEYTGISNRKSYTPFLDSLMKKSLVFTNAYANGKTSIDGIPAILASIPNFMERPYINSAYSNNNIETLPSLLKTKNYYSAFFHGGTNGTMNFNSFAKIASFDDYFGRTEYNNDIDYDGQWGIWDEPFLQYMVKKISQFKQPFFTSVFTLSSHNPYLVPNNFKNKFDKGSLEIHESVGYADYALTQFFNQAKKQPWFKNTLFIITPDHTSISNDAFYANPIGQYNIPILFYKENEFTGTSHKTVEQIDILPSVLDYLNFDKPYYSMGNSVFSATNKPAIHYTNSTYELVMDSLYYQINNYKITNVFNVLHDSLLKIPLLGKYLANETKILNYTKAFTQIYNNDLNNNTTRFIDTKK